MHDPAFTLGASQNLQDFYNLVDVYLGSAGTGNRIGPTGDKTQITLFSLIALFILGIACINFMNLSTAQCDARRKEVSMRKALGAERRQLVGQFLGDGSGGTG